MLPPLYTYTFLLASRRASPARSGCNRILFRPLLSAHRPSACLSVCSYIVAFHSRVDHNIPGSGSIRHLSCLISLSLVPSSSPVIPSPFACCRICISGISHVCTPSGLIVLFGNVRRRPDASRLVRPSLRVNVSLLAGRPPSLSLDSTSQTSSLLAIVLSSLSLV